MLIDAKQLQSEYLKAYTVATIRLMVRDGVIPAVRVGRKLMFDPVDVIAALKLRKAVQS